MARFVRRLGRLKTAGAGWRSLVITLAVCGCLLVAACAGPVDPYRQALDGLAFPASWQAAKTVARGDGGDKGCVKLDDSMCPSVTRYYSAEGGLVAVHDEARSAAEQAGFAVSEDTSPACDRNTNSSRCSFVATKDQVRLEVYVYGTGEDPDRLGVGVPGQPTVRIIALQH